MNDARTAAAQSMEDFLASHGGPFFELQARLQLLHEHALKTGRRALIFIGIAWGVPFILGLPHSLSIDTANGFTYLTDPTVWAKFVIAIGAFLLAEQQVEQRLREKLRQVLSAPIIAPTSLAAAAAAVNQAVKQRNSGLAEVICLIFSVVASLNVLRHLLTVDVSSWAVIASPAGNGITLAGWWTSLISVPVFWFLALRGLWRHFVWSFLLRKIARLDLRLVSTHPDGKGGIAFLADYPNAYMTFIFGVSCAGAAAVGKNLLHAEASMTNIAILMGGWLIIVLALFAFPLAAFSRPLADLKKATLIRLSAQATQFQRLAERKLIGGNIAAGNAAEAEEVQDVADPGKSFDTTRKLSTFLLNRSALLPVAASALIPFAAVASTKVPFKDVFALLKKLLLL